MLLIILIAGSQQGANEKRLLNQLFNVSGYNKLERPVLVEENPLVVTFSIVIQQIIDVVGLRRRLQADNVDKLKWVYRCSGVTGGLGGPPG